MHNRVNSGIQLALVDRMDASQFLKQSSCRFMPTLVCIPKREVQIVLLVHMETYVQIKLAVSSFINALDLSATALSLYSLLSRTYFAYTLILSSTGSIIITSSSPISQS